MLGFLKQKEGNRKCVWRQKIGKGFIKDLNLPHITHSCYAQDNKPQVDTHNETNVSQPQAHPHLQHISIHISIKSLNQNVKIIHLLFFLSQVESILPLFPGPQATKTLFPLLRGCNLNTDTYDQQQFIYLGTIKGRLYTLVKRIIRRVPLVGRWRRRRLS